MWHSEWNAYYCPPFPEAYNQLAIIDQTGKPNNTGANGADYTPPAGSRVIRGTFYQLGKFFLTLTNSHHSRK